MSISRLTLLEIHKEKIIELIEKDIYFLNRKLNLNYLVYATEKEILSKEYEKDSILKVQMDFFVDSCKWGIIKNSPNESFFRNIRMLVSSQYKKFTSNFWDINTWSELENCHLCLPVLEKPKYMIFILKDSSKKIERTQNKWNLEESSLESLLMDSGCLN